MDGKENFAISFALNAGNGMCSIGDWDSPLSDAAQLAARQPLPRPLLAAQGYLELATGLACRLGLAPRLRRQMLRKVLTLAVGCTVPRAHRLTRQLLIGQALRMLGRYDMAMVALKKAANDRLLRRDALLAVAWCQKRSGRLDEAITAVTRALATAPDDAALHFNLACYLALSEQPRAALYELAWALELQPSLRYRAASEVDFDSLRGSAAFTALTDPGRLAPQRPSND
jgi:tetratricopeptide (TPR) repeat protein